MRSWVCLLLAAGVTATACAAEADPFTNAILDEGFNHSQVAAMATYLTDRIGGRLTNSPQMRVAESWTQQQLRGYGLQNVHTEAFEFGRGWSIQDVAVRMVSPREVRYRAIPVAWTPPTNGTVSAEVIFAPIARAIDFDQWRGKLRGRIVLISEATPGSEPDRPAFRRLRESDLQEDDVYHEPDTSPSQSVRETQRAQLFEHRRDEFLAQEGAVASIRQARREGGLVGGEGYGFRVGETPRLPAFELAAEDYRQIVRLAGNGNTPRLEVRSAVQYYDKDLNAYNIIADIPGRSSKSGYVMAGAHLDSWAASDGASDNAAGCAVVMEAARILQRISARPMRTIRFALWSGEEQGMFGSLAYIERHLATRPALNDPEQRRIMPYLTWDSRWPIQRGPEYTAISGYYNIDNGSGRIRGIYSEGNVAVVPLFKEWLRPFASLGATQVGASPTGGTDHVVMRQIGIPAFQFIQDPLDYSRTHHSSIDTFDHLKIDDLKQAAVILASLLLHTAELPEALPRMPMPTQPQTDSRASQDDSSDDPS